VLYAFLTPFAVGLFRALFRLRAVDARHVPATGPVLLVSNHASYLDSPLIAASVRPRQVSFLAKAELFDIPLFGGFIRRLNARPLRREGGDARALRTGLRVLEEGGVLLIFPEGTRGDERVLREGKAGAGMIAVLSRAPVVPVYISGSGQAWPRGRRLPRRGRVTVSFGAPLHFARVEGAERKEQYEAASRAMMGAIARLRDRVIGAPLTADESVQAVGGAGVATPQGPSQIH
jgi:1-acyl-sn-glycerol-3-phosphate acyltransferase